ncbi:unnamed protein product [Gordionus sp. m RMFG-2023]
MFIYITSAKNIRQFRRRLGRIKAFATADSYNLQNLHNTLTQNSTYNIKLASDDIEDVLYVQLTSDETRENPSIFFFEDGVSVFWNIYENEIKQILSTLKNVSTNAYESNLIEEECDTLDFLLHENQTKFHDGKIYLQSKNSNILELYTFSNSLAQSVKLSIWESRLDKYGASLEQIVEDMQFRSKIEITEDKVLKKAGELFKLRHQINLTSDLLDPPDFYWDRENLECLFIRTCNYLNIPKRTKIMNEQLNHCFDIINLLKSYLNDKHHIRLEWMIIILICVEVILGLLTTYKAFEPKDQN